MNLFRNEMWRLRVTHFICGHEHAFTGDRIKEIFVEPNGILKLVLFDFVEEKKVERIIIIKGDYFIEYIEKKWETI